MTSVLYGCGRQVCPIGKGEAERNPGVCIYGKVAVPYKFEAGAIVMGRTYLCDYPYVGAKSRPIETLRRR